MAEPLSPAELAEIEARAEAASAGPWLNHVGEFIAQAGTFMAICRVNLPVINTPAGTRSGGPGSEQPNKDFIAASRSDVVALTAALRAAWAERDEAKGYTTRLLAFLAPQCGPCDSLMGLLLQLDNAIVGVEQRAKAAEAERDELHAVLAVTREDRRAAEADRDALAEALRGMLALVDTLDCAQSRDGAGTPERLQYSAVTTARAALARLGTRK